MSTTTLSNSLTNVAEFFESPEFLNGAALRPNTVREIAGMFRDMATQATRLELAAKGRVPPLPAEVWKAIGQAVNDPASNVTLMPVVPRSRPGPRDPKPAA